MRGIDWIDLAQYGQVVGACECFGFHKMWGILV